MLISRHYPFSSLYSGKSGVCTTESTIRGLLALAEIEINDSHDYDIQVNDKACYRNLLSGGPLGFGETYMDGQYRCPPGRITPAGV